MIIENKTCSVCDSSDWKSLDYLRDQKYWYERDYLIDEPVGFKICKNCGFVTYDYTDDEELKRRYESLVRIVDIGSLITKRRKLYYHEKFLKNKLKFDNDDNCINVLDYGAATGYFLKWFDEFIECGFYDDKIKIHDKDLNETVSVNSYGVESNDVLRKFGKYEYGIDITETIPDQKFDFISCYHTLEHVQYPDKLLDKFNDKLNDNGYLYISVPYVVQDAILDEPSGNLCSEFEELYHLNHVNQFTKVSLNNILNKAGFEIITEDELLYGYTVLCKKAKVPRIVIKENYLDIVSILEKQKKAMDLFKNEKWEEARQVFKGYPDAWVMNAIKNFKDLHEQERVLKEALEPTGNHYKIRKQLAYLYHQWDENKAKECNITNHIKQSKALFEELAEQKPGMEDFIYYLVMIESRFYKDYDKARKYLDKILEINPAKYSEVVNLIGFLWKSKE
jgi:SAM-dependent methyltransferase